MHDIVGMFLLRNKSYIAIGAYPGIILAFLPKEHAGTYSIDLSQESLKENWSRMCKLPLEALHFDVLEALARDSHPPWHPFGTTSTRN